MTTLYMMPVFDQYWAIDRYISYKKLMPNGLPNVEKLWKDDLFLHLYLAPPLHWQNELKDIVEAFNKVWENRNEIM